ncbi:MAG: excisionase family DNA-binding protein [Planctomycetota bacterium]|jgi:excisionase family DNA binding protein
MSRRQLPDKVVLSTGELAKACSVTKHTIITAIERDQIRASKTPGGHYRISKSDALEFMKEYNWLDADEESRYILILSKESNVSDLLTELFTSTGIEVRRAESSYEAAVMIERHRPNLIIVDTCFKQRDVVSIQKHIGTKEYGRETQLLIFQRSNGEGNWVPEHQHHTLEKPFTLQAFQKTVESLLFEEACKI